MVKVIIFDALIANQDRHCENWGVIQREGLVRFAPIFDNGASLGFNYNEDQVQLLVNDKRRFEAFTNRGNSIIGINQRKRPKVKELLSKVNFMFPVIVEEEIARLKGLQYDNVKHILELIPVCIMSDLKKHWVEKLLMYRKDWLLNWYEGELNYE